MRAGQSAYKYIGGSTYQCALFPLDYMYCTQVAGPGNYSHCCGTATDWKGSSSTYPYYAPVDCHRISLSGSDNICMYVSDSQVLTPSGVKWLAFLFMHDNNPPSKTSFNQGELIGHTGTAGFVTGDHVHLDQCLQNTISLVNSGQTCQAGNICWMVPNGVNPAAAYFTTDETQVQLLGQSFTKLEDYTPGPGPSGDGGGLGLGLILGIGAGRKKYMGLRRG